MKQVKIFLINLSKKSKRFGSFLRHARIFIKRNIYLYYFLFNKVEKNTVVFLSYDGRNFSDSPKSIFLEMQKENKDFKYVWLFKKPENERSLLKSYKNTIVLKDRTAQAYKKYASAQYIITNANLHEEIIKKKNQVFVQCWHGTPLKKLRCDIEYDSNLLRTKKEVEKTNDMDIKRFDYFLSPSAFCTRVFSTAFNLKKLHKENILIETGYPRNDILFNYDLKYAERIKKNLKIPKNKKVILYAPTFRDNQYNSGEGFSYELGISIEKIQEELGKDYIMLFRTHYYITNTVDLKKYKGFVYDVSNYDEINDLYIISDLLITDYSSVFFDYANLKRPILFYMYDLDLYQRKLRDFYFDLKELPGPIVRKEDELIKKIRNQQTYWDVYEKKYKKFNKKFNYLDGKNCSKKVIDIIMEDE